MAFSLNRIMLIGNLGADTETRYTENNTAVTSFSLATTSSCKNKSGEWSEETTWHNIVGFSLSDFLIGNLKKGRKLYVEGRLKKRSYDDKDGIKRYSTEVVVSNGGLIVLDESLNNNNDQNSNSQQNPQPSQQPQPVIIEDNDDDLPF